MDCSYDNLLLLVQLMDCSSRLIYCKIKEIKKNKEWAVRLSDIFSEIYLETYNSNIVLYSIIIGDKLKVHKIKTQKLVKK